MKWLDDISYIFLLFAAVLMIMMPFQPEPHLLEKYHLLLNGELNKTMDMFDVLWHLLPSLLLLLKVMRSLTSKKSS